MGFRARACRSSEAETPKQRSIKTSRNVLFLMSPWSLLPLNTSPPGRNTTPQGIVAKTHKRGRIAPLQDLRCRAWQHCIPNDDAPGVHNVTRRSEAKTRRATCDEDRRSSNLGGGPVGGTRRIGTCMAVEMRHDEHEPVCCGMRSPWEGSCAQHRRTRGQRGAVGGATGGGTASTVLSCRLERPHGCGAWQAWVPGCMFRSACAWAVALVFRGISGVRLIVDPPNNL